MTQSDQIIIADFSSDSFVAIKEFPHPTQMSVLPVVAVKGEEIRPVGTCFAISNHGLVLTARHVIDEALGLIDGWPKDEKQWIGAVYAAESTPDDKVEDAVGGIVLANRIHFNPHLDIAAMHLNLPINTKTSKSLRMPCFALGFGLPVVGESCFGLGYHLMGWNNSSDGAHTHSVIQSYSATVGKINRVYVPRRDSINLNFPCFEVSARFDGGMSGGPVVNQAGGVVGVVCSSFGDPEGEGHISYASLIGPGLFLVIDSDVGNGVIEKRFLYDFVTGGSVVSDGCMESLYVQRQDDVLRIKFSDNFTMTSTLGN